MKSQELISIKGCRKCHLPPEVHPIFSSFNGQRWMLVGQAPGVKEQHSKVLFIGPAGRRLFKWLNAAGFEEEKFRSFCYITAVMKCFPGKGKRGDLKPSKAQLANCAPLLEKELILVKPEVLIPVGQLAIGYFLGRVKLEEVIGKRFIRNIGGKGVLVIPLPHPSGASVWTNRPENRARIARAIGLIKRARNLFGKTS